MYQIFILGVVVVFLIAGMVIYNEMHKENDVRMGKRIQINPKDQKFLEEMESAEYAKGIPVIDAKRQRYRNKNIKSGEKASKLGKGALHDPCPCADGYECSALENICKIKEGKSCIQSNHCGDNAFCFNSLCTMKPTLPEGHNLLVLRNTPMVVEKNRFQVPKDWWDLVDIVDICDSGKENDSFYLLSDLGRIFRVHLSPKVGGKIEIAQVSRMEQLIFFDKHYYGLSKGYLYQLENEDDTVWSWARVDKLYGTDISALQIYEFTKTEDDLFVLMTNEGIYRYDLKEGWNDEPDTSVRRIAFGRTRDHFIQEGMDGKILYSQKGKEYILQGDIIDFAVHKEKMDTIYILYGNNVCYMNEYDRKDGANEISVRLLGKVNRVKSTKKACWGLSTYQEFPIHELEEEF